MGDGIDLGDLIEALEAIAPIGLAEDWDRVGLMVGRPREEVRGVLLALDATVEAVRAARERGLNVLLTHHPLLFKPLEVVDPSRPVGAVVAEALKGGICVVAAHTNLDSAAGGVNDVLAELLGLTRTVPLLPMEGRPGVGLGRIGELEAPRTMSAVTDLAKARLGLKAVRTVGRPERAVSRVAVCGGSGGDLVEPALDQGADLLLTGEASHHSARAAEFLGLGLIEAGHYATEAPVVPVLARRLRTALEGAGASTPVEVLETQREPFEIG